MLETVSPSIDYQLVSENYGRFVIEPLEPGYGITLGNAIRRILLSSLPGAAVVAVQINGMQHEFSTIPHIKEDVLEFLLNIKGIRLRRLTDYSDTLTLEASGEGTVTAGDIKPSANFEIVNPELHLATLDSAEAKLNVEFTVEIGRGYIPAHHVKGLPIGVLPVDAIFTPIKRVNYDVKKTRVGDKSNYDHLVLDVWTDNTISPQETVAESARILIQQFTTFNQLDRPSEESSSVEDSPSTAVYNNDMPLDQLCLSMRTLNALRRGGIINVGDLRNKNKEDLLDLRNFGQKSWNEVQGKLLEKGLLGESALSTEESKSDEDEAQLLTSEDEEISEIKRKLQEKFIVRDEK